MKQTQCQRLLTWLKTVRTISPLEAWMELGIYRLASRIYDLKKAGWNISKGNKKVLNKFGERLTVAVYRLDEENRFKLIA